MIFKYLSRTCLCPIQLSTGYAAACIVLRRPSLDRSRESGPRARASALARRAGSTRFRPARHLRQSYEIPTYLLLLGAATLGRGPLTRSLASSAARAAWLRRGVGGRFASRDVAIWGSAVREVMPRGLGSSGLVWVVGCWLIVECEAESVVVVARGQERVMSPLAKHMSSAGSFDQRTRQNWRPGRNRWNPMTSSSTRWKSWQRCLVFQDRDTVHVSCLRLTLSLCKCESVNQSCAPIALEQCDMGSAVAAGRLGRFVLSPEREDGDNNCGEPAETRVVRRK